MNNIETPVQLVVDVADGHQVERIVFFPLRDVTLAMVVDYFETTIGPVISISDNGGHVYRGLVHEHEVLE